MFGKSVRILAVAAVITVSGTAEARADFNFREYCTLGSIRACASVEVQTVWDGVKTSVTVRVANLQGWTDFPFTTLAAALYEVELRNEGGGPDLDDPDPTGLVVAAIDGAGEVGDAESEWEVRASEDEIELRLDGRDNASDVISDPEGALFGCDVNLGPPTNYFTTCNGGWIEFSFMTEYEWTDQIELALEWEVVIDGEGYQCQTDEDDEDDDDYCVPITSTVPEPATMILLGSGLLGLGGMGIVRRRRGLDVTSD